MSDTAPRRPVADRPLELLAVALLGIATIGTAWCGFQASRWSSEESDLVQSATDARIESSRLFGLATQRVSYDSAIVAQYAEAIAEGNQRLVEFYRETLIRPGFEPIVDRWTAQVRAEGEAPANLLEDEDYLDQQFADFEAKESEADEFLAESREAGDNANDFVATTLVLASALFFAGITTSFRYVIPRIVLLGGSSLLVAYAAARLIDLPVA